MQAKAANSVTSERHAHGDEEVKSCIYNEYGVLVGGFCLRAFIVAVYIF